MLSMNEMFDKAVEVAIDAHKGVVDKGGMPYIMHPLRVSNKCKTFEGKIVGLLHDVVEDSDYTFEDLEKMGFSKEIIDSLKLLTHTKNEKYFDYIQKIKDNKISVEVKLSDLEDNMNLNRLLEITEKDLKRIEKYKKAYAFLKQFDSDFI